MTSGWWIFGVVGGAAAFCAGDLLAERFGAGALPRRWAGVLAGILAALGCAARFSGVQAVVALAVCTLLYALGRIDCATMQLPDPLNAALGGLGAVWVVVAGLCGAPWGSLLPGHIIGAAAVSVPLHLLRRIWPGSLGGGDVKFVAAAGLLLGWAVIPAFLLAVAGGGVWAIAGVAAGRLRPGTRFAFGPFLCAATAIALFAGDWLVGCFYGGLL